MLSYCPHANIISSAIRRAPLQNDKLQIEHACARNGTTTSHHTFLPNGLSHHPSNHMNGHVVSKRHPVPGPGYQIVDPPQEILPRQSKMTPSPRPDPGPGPGSKNTVRFNVSCSLQNSHDDLPRISEPRARADRQHRLSRSQSTQTDPPCPAATILSRSPSAPPGPVTCHHRAEEPPRLRARGAVTRASGSAHTRHSDSSQCSTSSGKGGELDSSDSADSSFSVISARNPAEEYPLSIILIGDSGAGKTCLVARLADNVFGDNYDVTVGIDFNVARFELTDGRPIRLQMWDTAGQEKYRAITSSYYRKAMGVVLVYDVTRRESLANILGVWQKEVEKYAEPDVALMLVGNKMDLDDYRTITTRVGARLASQLGAIFYEVSAKEDLNVRSAFQAFADDIMENVYSKRNPCLSPDAVHLDHSNDRNEDKTKSTCNCS